MSGRYDDTPWWFYALAVMVFGFVVGVATGRMTAEIVRNQVRQEAIEAGAGHWTCDPETGETTFEWTGRETKE